MRECVRVAGGVVCTSGVRRPRPEPRWRYEIRLVDHARRVYVYATSHWKFFDAVLTADVGHFDGTANDFVVWDRIEKRVLYDTRLGDPIGDE